MKWRCILAVLIGLSITDVATFAEKPPEAERLSPTPPSLDRDVYFGDAGMARFQLIAGRLRLHPSIHRKSRESRDEAGVHESIAVQSRCGIPSLQYAFHCPTHQLSLSVKDGESVRFEMVDSPARQRHVLEQFVNAEVVWHATVEGETQTLVGKSLLHLRMSGPDHFDATFGPVITPLLHGKSLASFTRDANANLMTLIRQSNTTSGNPEPVRVRVLELVDAMASSRRQDRDASTRQLLGMGTPVLTVLASIHADDLEPEQRARIQAIETRLRRHDNDTPANWATQLAYDRDYLTMLADTLATDDHEQVSRHVVAAGMKPIARKPDAVVRIAARR